MSTKEKWGIAAAVVFVLLVAVSLLSDGEPTRDSSTRSFRDTTTSTAATSTTTTTREVCTPADEVLIAEIEASLEDANGVRGVIDVENVYVEANPGFASVDSVAAGRMKGAGIDGIGKWNLREGMVVSAANVQAVAFTWPGSAMKAGSDAYKLAMRLGDTVPGEKVERCAKG